MAAASSADVNAELVAKRCQPPVERTDNTRRDAGGMPVHAHHGAEGLKPKRIGQPPQQLVAPVVVDDSLRHHDAKARHSVGEPTGHAPPVQWQIRAASPSCHPFTKSLAVSQPGNMLMSRLQTGESEQQGKMVQRQSSGAAWKIKMSRAERTRPARPLESARAARRAPRTPP
jgi:hypothetical protein